MTERSWIICDLDGTLCNHAHRLHHIMPPAIPVEGWKKDWDAYNSALGHDVINYQVNNIILAAHKDGFNIALVTGRQRKYHSSTLHWLRRYGVEYNELHMRATGDMRSDFVIKQEILDECFRDRDVMFAIDDRQQVVDMWRRNDIFTFQCAKGDF